MYVVKNIGDKIEDSEQYKLCYIDRIEETYSDWTPETKTYMETEQYIKDKEIYGWRNPNCVLKNYPTKDFIRGKQEFYAYFCKRNPEDMWGDDFDDIPYEHNSEAPYDKYDDKEETIIKIPFLIDIDSFIGDNLIFKEPKDYAYNSPFSAEDINLGAVPWLFVRTCRYKGNNTSVYMSAGTTIPEFIDKLEKIKSMISNELRGNLKYMGSFKRSDGELVHAVMNTKSYVIRFYDNDFNRTFAFYKSSDYLGYDLEEVYQVYEDDREWNWNVIKKNITDKEPKGLIWNIENC